MGRAQNDYAIDSLIKYLVYQMSGNSEKWPSQFRKASCERSCDRLLNTYLRDDDAALLL